MKLKFPFSLMLSFPVVRLLYSFVILVLGMGLSIANAQVTGDYKSRATGNWSDFATWSIYDGTSWQNASAGQVPGGTNESDAANVYLESGITVTLTNDASCKDLHLNGASDVIRINTSDFALDIWGKMRTYTGTAPGTTDNTSAGSGIAGWITTNTNGRLRFKGTVDRTIFEVNEVSANSRSAGWRFDFAFDSGITGTCKTVIRCGDVVISSGVLDVMLISEGLTSDGELRIAGNDYTAQPGNGVSGGTCLIKSGAVLKAYRLLKNNPTTVGNSLAFFTMEDGATLIAKQNCQISALNYSILGDVIFEASTAQNFISGGGKVDAVSIINYNNVVLGSTTVKTLVNNVTVAGKLTLQGTSSLSVGSYALAYDVNGILEYNGSALQTTTNSEFPSTNGPVALNINNVNGVKLHANRSLNGQLSLLAGIFDLQANNFTLGASSPAVAGTPDVTNMIVTSGVGELRKIYSAAGNFFFPVGETSGTTEYTYAMIDVNAADVFDGTTYVGIRVIDNDHPADNGTSRGNVSRYWSVQSNLVNINYDGTFQYLSTDVNGVEDSLDAYVYSDETSLASGLPLNRVNSAFHRISITAQSTLGFVTAANHCSISGNMVDYAGDTEFCGSSTLSAPFTGTAAVVSSATPMYQWQQKVNNGAWSDISGANQEVYTEAATLAAPNTFYYRRSVSDPASCLAADVNESNEVDIELYEDISSNQIGSDQIVVDGNDPAAFTSIGSLTGGNGTYTYQWQSSATAGGPYTDIASATDLTYDSEVILSTTYFVRQVKSGVCSSSISNEVSITITPVTANQSSEGSTDINVYPNPTSGLLYIDLSGMGQNGHASITVTDSQGSPLLKRDLSVESGLMNIDMSKYASGLYYLHVLANGEATSYKISKR